MMKLFLVVKDVLKPICGENEVIIKATYSSLNYKDALSSVGNPGVTRVFHILLALMLQERLLRQNLISLK